MPGRRATLLALLVPACAGRPEPVALPPGPISYSYLMPLGLKVANVEISEASPPLLPGDLGPRLPTPPAEAVRIMGRDRLLALGTEARAVFSVTQASLLRGRDSITCQVACRLDILSAENSSLGFVEAQSRRAVTGRDAERPNAPEALLRQAMDDLNVEFEFQLRRNLRDWLAPAARTPDGTLPAPAAPPEVEREDLTTPES